MHLTDNDIANFKQLYREKFGIELTSDEAHHKLNMLVLQMDTIYKPITEEQVEELRKQDAMALAELIYDVYEAKKQTQKKKQG